MAIAVQQPVFAPTGTKITAIVDGSVLVQSRNAMLLRQSPFKIAYGFPREEVDSTLLESNTEAKNDGRLGPVQQYDLNIGPQQRPEAAYEYLESRDGYPDLRGYLFFSWDAADRWFEEEEELIGHPRDPYTRIDVRRTSYHIEVKVEGVIVADTRRAFALLETGLPVRYYIPSEDVVWDYLIDSETQTVCPYKGRSRYWHIQVDGTVYNDRVWAYLEPFQDADPVRDALCFHQEKLTLLVDGVEERKPPKHFTK